MNEFEKAQNNYIVWLTKRLNEAESFCNTQSGWNRWAEDIIQEGREHRLKIIESGWLDDVYNQ